MKKWWKLFGDVGQICEIVVRLFKLQNRGIFFMRLLWAACYVCSWQCTAVSEHLCLNKLQQSKERKKQIQFSDDSLRRLPYSPIADNSTKPMNEWIADYWTTAEPLDLALSLDRHRLKSMNLCLILLLIYTVSDNNKMKEKLSQWLRCRILRKEQYHTQY